MSLLPLILDACICEINTRASLVKRIASHPPASKAGRKMTSCFYWYIHISSSGTILDPIETAKKQTSIDVKTLVKNEATTKHEFFDFAPPLVISTSVTRTCVEHTRVLHAHNKARWIFFNWTTNQREEETWCCTTNQSTSHQARGRQKKSCLSVFSH